MHTTLVRGNLVSNEALDHVKKEKALSYQKLLEILGPPSYIEESPEKWYYISRTILYSALYTKIQDQRIVIVYFKDHVTSDVTFLEGGYQDVPFHPQVMLEKNILSAYWDNLVVRTVVRHTKYSKQHFLPEHF